MCAATPQYAFRLPTGLVDRIDHYAAMRARIDGRPCTRSDALRLLLEKGLRDQVPADLETPATSEAIRGNITDPPFEPATKKKQHRRQDRVSSVKNWPDDWLER